jgi:hypothetical protein
MAPDRDLKRRARYSYELARFAKGLRTAALVVPMTVVALGGCGHRETALAIAAALAVLATGLVWRGGVAGRAVVPGLVAGVVPLGFPLVVCPLCARFGAAHLPMLVCVAGGVASGAIVAAWAAREAQERAPFVFVAGLVAALAGSMGCAILGLGGVAAMAVGLALATPVALAVAPRAAGG